MLPPQSIPDPVNSQSAPADSTAVVNSAVDQFNNAFSKALHFLTTGEWELLYEHLSSGLVYLTGIMLERGLQAFAAFLLLYLIYRGLSITLFRVLDRSESIEPGLQSVLLKTFRVVMLVFIGTVVLDQLGLNVAVLIGGLSIAGIIVGFAARDSLENFISGVTILVDQPFHVGDFIEIGDDYGQVDEITLRSTRIRTVRNEIIILPNSEMITQQVINHTKRNVLRIDVEFGIAYKEYPEEARQVLLPLTEDDDRVLSEPAPSVVVTSLNDSSVDMVLRFFIRDPTQEVPIRCEYTEKVREKLREVDIEIPFPHQQLFLDEAKAFEGTTLKPSSNGDNASSASE